MHSLRPVPSRSQGWCWQGADARRPAAARFYSPLEWHKNAARVVSTWTWISVSEATHLGATRGEENLVILRVDQLSLQGGEALW